MKLSKTKKILLLGASIGFLATIIVTPIVLLNTNKDNQDEQNQKDVESVVKILEEKNQDERILKFASTLIGKIVANNQEKIVTKIKTLIGKTNLKEVKIEILMKNDQDILPNFTKIQIKVSKGKYSKTLDSEKPYFVIREQNQQEIIADVKSVKTALTNLVTKTLELKAKVGDKSVNGNKDAILNTLKQVEGYSEIDFKVKEVEIKVKENSNNLPSSEQSPINIIFILSKGTYNSELTGFSAKQLDSDQVNEITEELNQLKSSLENLETKEVEVYAPSEDKTITHNKDSIKSAIENLDGYDEIDLDGASLEVKNSSDNLPTNDQPPTGIILILSKNNVDVEVQGFSAKQSLTITPQDKINQIKEKITDKDILIAPNVSTENQGEIQSAIKNQLQKENPFLTNDDLSKISTSLSTLDMGVKTQTTLIITIDSTTSILNIDVEKINLLKNSNIINGYQGTIFQDEFKNLWSMGFNQKLQVLKANQNSDNYANLGWINDNSIGGDVLLNGSNITNGQGGVVFQDEFKNLWTMGNNTSLQVLKVNEVGDDYVNTGWTSANDSGLTNGSNITNGNNGVIFQDEFKNLWSMGNGTSLQVLKVNNSKNGYVSTGWTSANDSGLTNGSNITSGKGGVVFQDEFKNLWTMGVSTRLQVLEVNQVGDDYVNTGWTSANDSGLLNGSNIIDGLFGKIFQDEFKNLWAMGNNTSLQVLEANNAKNGYVNTGWTSVNDSGLTNGSNIIDGTGGVIFQDEFKNLWSMGNGTSLQVLEANNAKNDYVSTGWTSANDSGLTNGSNITDGNYGVIFQDEFKNLWAIGNNTSLQVLEVNNSKNGYVSTGWTSANNSGLINDSSVLNGTHGIIFQDEFKNLWVMSNTKSKKINNVWKYFFTKLQVLKANQNGDGYVNSWQKPSD